MRTGTVGGRMTGLIVFHKAQNGLAHAFRVRDFFKMKLLHGSGGVEPHIAKVQKRVQSAAHRRGNVLYHRQMHFRRDAIEQAVLFDVDNALGRHDPRVQIVVNKFLEEERYHGKIVHETNTVVMALGVGAMNVGASSQGPQQSQRGGGGNGGDNARRKTTISGVVKIKWSVRRGVGLADVVNETYLYRSDDSDSKPNKSMRVTINREDGVQGPNQQCANDEQIESGDAERCNTSFSKAQNMVDVEKRERATSPMKARKMTRRMLIGIINEFWL